MINILLKIDMSILRTTLFKGFFNRFGSANGPKLTVLALNIQKKKRKTCLLCSQTISALFFLMFYYKTAYVVTVLIKI